MGGDQRGALPPTQEYRQVQEPSFPPSIEGDTHPEGVQEEDPLFRNTGPPLQLKETPGQEECKGVIRGDPNTDPLPSHLQ